MASASWRGRAPTAAARSTAATVSWRLLLADEALAPHGRAVVGEALGEAEEGALGGAGGLVAQPSVPDTGQVDAAGEFLGCDVDVEALEGEEGVGGGDVGRHSRLLSPLAEGAANDDRDQDRDCDGDRDHEVEVEGSRAMQPT